MPFPFRPGLVELPELLGFDATGERLVATTRSGIPHAIDTTDGSVEVLPRGMVDGELMKTVFAILPVNGGVVICGTMLLRKNEPYHLSNETAITITTSMVFDASATIPVTDSGTAAMYHHVAAHYDWVSRTVHVFDFGPFTQTPNWVAYPDLHSVVLLNGSEKCPIALDLSTSKRGGLFEWTGRVGEARGRNGQGSAAPKNVQLIKDSITLKIDELFLHHAKGILLLDQNWSSIQWEKFEPTEDGQPVLDGATIHRAQFANNVLAIAMTKGKQPELRLFRGPDPTALGVVPLDDRSKLFTLSPDGQKLAWMRDRRELVVAETSRLPHVLATARHAGLHNQLEIDCDAFQFQLRIGIGQFQHHFGVGSSDSFHILNFKPDPIKKMTGNSGHRTVNRKLPAGYDRNRFTVIGVTNGDAFRVIGDRHGQVILLNRLDELLVVFLIRREKAAAWTPEGGFWGDPELIGGPSSPTSAGAIATVIRAAMEAS